MYEYGIIILPNDIFELAKMGNPGVIPLAARPTGFELDAKANAIIISMETTEDLGESPIPVGAHGDRFRVT